MRRLSVIFCFIVVLVAANFSMAAAHFPTLTGRVVDDAHILSTANTEQLTAKLAAHEQKTSEQIVVVTVPSLNGMAIEDFGYQLGRAWGIGQKGKNNGALIIVAPQEHKTRIEVGYGMEDHLTDAACATIISRLMIPAFRGGDYDDGVAKGTDAVLSALGDPESGDAEDGGVQAGAPAGEQNAHFPLLIFFVVFFWFCFAIRRRSSLGPLVLGSMLGRSGGFGSDGGGFGGGFSGGGGGFGGGGASGSW